MSEKTEAMSATAEVPKTQGKLDELTKAASLQYSLKNFSAAADHYADAVEIQAELNGEMAPENAELLFYYGRALYKVAIAKSDVLGGKVAQEEKKKKKPKAQKAKKEAVAEGSSNGAQKAEEGTASVDSKPYFQLTGDENWDTEDEDEDEDEDGEAQQEEEQDDFADAYEVFEIARVLYSKKLEALDTNDDSGKAKGKAKAELSSDARAIKEKLADCHGFLVEISLENERFLDAVTDARSAVTLQEELHPIEHENVTEAHYSLSLALEFASTAPAFEEKEGEPKAAEDASQMIDWDLRNEAIKHTELAVEGLEKRLQLESEALSANALTAEQKKEKKAIVEDKKGLLEDLKTRITDLKSDPTKQPPPDTIDPTLFKGLLGGLLGADPATQKAKLAEATSSANDISGLVKTRKKEKVPALVPVQGASEKSSSSGKRKAEDEDGMEGKRARTEEAL
ncbi:hypothetical protein P280DRAFT_428324 [Massarina eburnea CBS 473.64]|uniref:Tetratricopeptide SHNi-TPR domain-containing protein n=1 Tax=Massarina eburnea CBS 473.64 TaxID=1395130 RepID=A0A6A6RZG8_9PLEO|nr:hypothetical protein P280DRAFT_428324 [Massarina eburnea CBS 473.64]